MKYIIFAGGHGTRLWPLSRRNSPKQFEKVFNQKSTLQLAYERITPIAKAQDIIISTNKKFEKIILEQLPNFKKENLILEPEKKDLAGAVGYNIIRLYQLGYRGPIAILWSDQLIENTKEFRKALKVGEAIITKSPYQFVYLGEKPTFPNNNIGWIKLGKTQGTKKGFKIFDFEKWYYRPNKKTCKMLFSNHNALWNTGYFITSVEFLVSLYQKYQPEIFDIVSNILKAPKNFEKLYLKLPEINFDDAIIKHVKATQATVLEVKLTWNDPGTLYALKKTLDKSSKNVEIGKIFSILSKDCLFINHDKEKLLTAIGLNGFMVINTKDAFLIVHKDKIGKIKELLKKLEDADLKEYI